MRRIHSVRSVGGSRSQSEVLGFILILGIIVTTAVIVVAFGAQAIGDTSDRLTDERAEKALTQFDSKAALVALEEADSQRVAFSTDEGERFSVDEDAGEMRVTIENQTSEYTEEILNLTLGAVVYENDGAKLAYQGGGVWRPEADGQLMVSPPEFHYRDGTLTLPAITVRGDAHLGERAVIQHDGVERQFPVTGEENLTNPLTNHRVDVTVQSEYYRGWGEYFRERTDGSVEYDHEESEVTVTLVSPVDVDEVTAASASLSAGGEFNVTGTSASDCDAAGDVFTDSYNSSLGTYCEQFDGDLPPGTAGDVVYGKDIDISDGTGGSNFFGDVRSGQTVTVDDSEGTGQPSVYGNIEFVENCIADEEEGDESCEDRIHEDSDGEVRQIDGVTLTNEVDWFIETSMAQLEGEADAVNPAIEGERLEAGIYYFDDLHLETNLELDTSDGEVVLAVDGGVELAEGATIEVTGDEHAELFINGDGVSGDELVMPNNAKIYNDDDDATRFRLYAKSDFDATLGGGGSGNLARFVGVIYAPPGEYGSGSVTLDGGEVFGGILTGTTSIHGGSIHYDESLEGKYIVPEDTFIIRVTFLHVTENRIQVTSD